MTIVKLLMLKPKYKGQFNNKLIASTKADENAETVFGFENEKLECIRLRIVSFFFFFFQLNV